MINNDQANPTAEWLLQQLLEVSRQNLEVNKLILAELQIRNDDAGIQMEAQAKTEAELVKETALISAEVNPVIKDVMKILKGAGHGFR